MTPPSTRPPLLATLASVILKPEWVFLPFVALGVLLWMLPPDHLGGFRYRERITPEGSLLIVVWYLTIVLAAYTGRRLGQRLELPHMLAASSENRFYALVTITGAIGVAATWFTVVREVDILGALTGKTANLIKIALYEDYARGLHTLRYAVALSAGLALFRIGRRGKIRWVDTLNLAMLLSVSFVSARLLFVQALFVALGLSVKFEVHRLLRLRAALVLGAIFALGIGAMTFVRTAGSYAVRWGITNPLMMGYIEVKRYVGVPIQVSLGTARLAFAGVGSRPPAGDLSDVLPTFFRALERSRDHAGGIGEQWYLSEVDVSKNLTKNSAFATVVGSLGSIAIPFIGVTSLLFGFVFGWLHRGSVASVCASLVVLYGFAELWRTYYFNSGSFLFLLGLAATLGVISLPVRSSRPLVTP